MRLRLLLASILVLSGLAGCSSEPEIQYQLTAEQLAWQGYQQGQTLRFANSSTAAVRTYQVVQVTDELIKIGKSSSLWPWSTKGMSAVEHYYALVQRTDNASTQRITACSVAPTINGDPKMATCTFDWEGMPIQAELPAEALNGTIALDSVTYGAKLLPTATLGPTSYTQVAKLTRYEYLNSSAAMTLYYAKGKGVVAFSEAKTGFWYRLP